MITTGLRSGSVYAVAVRETTKASQTEAIPASSSCTLEVSLCWQYSGHAPVFSSPISVSDPVHHLNSPACPPTATIIVCDVRGHITALDAGTGQPLWEQQVPEEVFADGILLARSMRATVQRVARGGKRAAVSAVVAVRGKGGEEHEAGSAAAVPRAEDGEKHATGAAVASDTEEGKCGSDVVLLPTGKALVVAIDVATGALLGEVLSACGHSARLHCLPACVCRMGSSAAASAVRHTPVHFPPSSLNQRVVGQRYAPATDQLREHLVPDMQPCSALAVTNAGTVWLLQMPAGHTTVSPGLHGPGDDLEIGMRHICDINCTSFSGAVACPAAGCVVLGGRDNGVYAVDMPCKDYSLHLRSN